MNLETTNKKLTSCQNDIADMLAIINIKELERGNSAQVDRYKLFGTREYNDVKKYIEIIYEYETMSSLDKLSLFLDPSIITMIYEYSNEKNFDYKLSMTTFYNNYIKKELRTSGKPIGLDLQLKLFKKFCLDHP